MQATVTNHRNYDEARDAVAFITVKGENFAQSFARRTTRPFEQWRETVANTLREYGAEFTGIYWDQRAGCSSCPCSPGFVLVGTREAGTAYYVTIDADAVTTDEDVAADRLIQLHNSL